MAKRNKADDSMMEDAIHFVELTKVYSPALIDEKEHILLRCSTGFWLKEKGQDKYKKQGEKYVVISEEQATSARARYLLKFGYPEPEIDEPKPDANETYMPKFGEPIFTAHFDNEKEMEVLVNVFGKDALEAANGDMDVILKNLEEEKKKLNSDNAE